MPQFIGFSLLIGNLTLLINAKKLSKLTALSLLPILTIFCVYLEIMSIRSHFVASQILCLVLIQTFYEKKMSENLILIFISMLFNFSIRKYLYLLPNDFFNPFALCKQEYS